jgi:hypothetical protein
MQWKRNVTCLHWAKLSQNLFFFVVELLEQEMNRCSVLYLLGLIQTFYCKDICDVYTFAIVSF